MEPTEATTGISDGQLSHQSTSPMSTNTSVISSASAIPTHKDPLISFTVPALMFTAGVVGNVLAIIFLARSSKEQKRTVFYRLVGALACTDLIGTCATSPVTLAVYANKFKWIGGKPLCNYESFMLIFASCSTIFIICTMAADRFVSICHPFFYDRHVTVGRTKNGIMAVWTFAFVMGVLPIIGFGENVIQFPGTWCFFTYTSTVLKNKIFAYLYAIIGFLGIIVTAILNLFVTSVLIKMQIRASKLTMACHSCTHRHNRETQMMILMIGIVLIFATCWCPFLVRIIVNQIYHKQVDVKVDLMTLRLASLNQILDPWVYILFRKELFVRIAKLFGNIFSFVCKGFGKRARLRRKSIEFSNASLNTYSNGKAIDSLENNYDSNDVYDSEISTNSSKSQNKRSIGNSKSNHNDRPSLEKLLSQTQPQCFGLRHPACLFCFTNLPQAFVMTLGTNQEVALDQLAAKDPEIQDSESNDH